jgi:hypothetical protein
VIFHTQGVSQLLIAAGALFIGYLPGGSLVGLIRRVWDGLSRPRGLEQVFAAAVAQRRAEARAGKWARPGGRVGASGANGPVAGDAALDSGAAPPVPTPFARRILSRT